MSKKPITHYMRQIHRVIGYLTIGMILVYTISGITLIYRKTDFMKQNELVYRTIEPNLSTDRLAEETKIHHFKVIQETDSLIHFDDGYYEKSTGRLTMMTKNYVSPIDRFVKLHKYTPGNHWIGLATTIFGLMLLMLAITSLFMYKPSGDRFKANVIYTVIGIAFTILLVMVC